MEPITTAIVTALWTGAAFVGEKAAIEVVKDAYAGLKGWIKRHYPGVSVEELEKQPKSKARQAVVQEDLEREGAAQDSELATLAQKLVELIQKQPDAARAVGVDLGELNQAKVTFGNVFAGPGATGVKVDKVTGGELSFQDVTAGSDKDTPKKA